MNDNISTIKTAWAGHREFANWLVKELVPTTVVDLGVDRGFSTFCFAEAGIGQVYGIDAFTGDEHAGFRDTYQQVMEFKESNGFDNVTIIKGLFDEVCASWTLPIDILHIDGLHTYEAVSNDYAQWTRFLSQNGVVLMHDVTCFPDVERFYNSLTVPKMYFTKSYGLGVVVKDPAMLVKMQELFPEAIIGNIGS
jgi:predicted O-methyltransferase YrrM